MKIDKNILKSQMLETLEKRYDLISDPEVLYEKNLLEKAYTLIDKSSDRLTEEHVNRIYMIFIKIQANLEMYRNKEPESDTNEQTYDTFSEMEDSN